MTSYEIRPLRSDDDLVAQRDLSDRAFGMLPDSRRGPWNEFVLKAIKDGRVLGAFENARAAGAAMYLDMPQWWHGRVVPMAGVAGVKMAPEDRGKGAGRRLTTALLDEIAARGYPLSALYPATLPVYRSLGWEIAGARYTARIPGRALRELVAPEYPGGDPPGLRRPGLDDGAGILSVIGRVHQAARDCGPVMSEDKIADWCADPAMFMYLADDGFLAYRWAEGSKEIFVETAAATSPQTLRAFWQLVASHTWIAGTVMALVAPSDPFWWMLREHDAELARRVPWMLRVVDAPAAIAARGFPAAVSAGVPLTLTDSARPSNSGRWELAVGSGKGALVPNARGVAQRDDELRMGARGLAALYSGAPVASLRLAGLAAGGSRDQDAALDAAFAASAFMYDAF